MCLSVAYKNQKDEANFLVKNVAKVSQEGEKILLTDLFEKVHEFKGTIKKIDLVENYIIIEEK